VTDPTAPFLHDWNRVGLNPHAQREYVAAELVRIAREGRPVLNEVMTAPFAGQSEIAMALLGEGALSEFNGGMVRLRLVDGAVPPHVDADGLPLPEADRGKVLLAKVGTKGGALNQSHTLPSVVTDPYSGPNLQRNTNARQPNSRYVRITRAGTFVSFAQAAVVLRQWGRGVNPQLSYRYGRKVVDNASPTGFRVETCVQSTQLVEELPLVDVEPATPPAPAPQKTRAA
jgi:hypothetical protein